MTTATPAATPATFREESAQLSFQQGSSDKVYHCQLTQAETGWSVTVQYGRRNSTLSADVKIERASYEEAKKIFDRTRREKISKGYQEKPQPSAQAAVPVSASGIPNPEGMGWDAATLKQNWEMNAPLNPPALTNSRGAASKEILFQPELLTRCTAIEADKFAADSRYIFQVKQDGDRLTLAVRDGERFGYNKLGQKVRLDPQLDAALATLCHTAGITRLLMDGEWEASGWYGWDILEVEFQHEEQALFSDLRSKGYADRLAVLDLLIPGGFNRSGILRQTRTAWSTETKRALLADTTLEGVAIKDRMAAFRPGRNGQHKKFKFEQTASFLVGPKPGRKANDGHRSVALYLFDPQRTPALRFVSTVKVAECYELPALDSIIEVRYLYAYPGGGVAQPAYFGKVRTDVRPADCTTAQLKFKASGDEENAGF